MKLTQEQIETILDELKPDMLKALKEEAVKNIQNNFTYAASGIISKAVEKWTAEEVVPEILKHLTESKEGLIQIGIKSAEEIVEGFSKAMTAQIKETLESSYKRSDLFKKLLGLGI